MPNIKTVRKTTKDNFIRSYSCKLELDASHSCNILMQACYSNIETVTFELHQELLRIYESPYVKPIIDFLAAYIKKEIAYEGRKPLKIFLTDTISNFFLPEPNITLGGSYTHRTTIYVSTANQGKPYSPNIIAGTLLHEAVHLICNLVHKNGCSPFPNTPTGKSLHANFINAVEAEIKTLSEDLAKLKLMFTLNLHGYNTEKYPNEFVARTIEVLINFPDGELILKTHMPKLLAGFMERVLNPINILLRPNNLPENNSLSERSKKRVNPPFERPPAKRSKHTASFFLDSSKLQNTTRISSLAPNFLPQAQIGEVKITTPHI